MIYAHTNMNEVSPCTERTEEKPGINGVGIYGQMLETREVLREVVCMLDQFRREIRSYDEIPDYGKVDEPSCFRDEVNYVNNLAFAIRGDLARLIDEFR